MTKISILTLVLLFGAVLATQPVLEWFWQEKQQAPEYLIIKIRHITMESTPDENCCLIILNAAVVEVVRTSSGLSKDDLIEIKYRYYLDASPEKDSNIPILELNETYPAFLKKNNDQEYYEPAAGGYSFRGL